MALTVGLSWPSFCFLSCRTPNLVVCIKCGLLCFAAFPDCTAVLKSNTSVAGPRLNYFHQYVHSRRSSHSLLRSILWSPIRDNGQAIIFRRCGFLFFLAYFQWSQIGRVPYFHTWCGFSTNLECRSEFLKCAARGSLKIEDAKIRPLRRIAHLSGYIFATKACVDNLEKNLLNSNVSST